MDYSHFPSELEDKTRKLLKELPRQIKYRHISEATGIKVTWLCDFASGKLKLPSVGRVETLYNYLSPTPLFPKN